MSTSTQSKPDKKAPESAVQKMNAASTQTVEDRRYYSSGMQGSKHPVKEQLVCWLLKMSKWYLQNSLIRFGKHLYWKKICAPYLCWRDTELLCRTRFGIRMNLCPREFIQNRVLFFGVWEPNVTEIFDSLLQPGDVVVDVGANVGYYTLLAAKKVGKSGHVYAVEPNPAVRTALHRHLDLNGFKNVTVIEDGAWDTTASGTLHVDGEDCGGSSLRILDGTEQVESIRLVRLDDVLPRNQHGRVRLIKVDIEGAEAHALRGLSETLLANPQACVIAEINPAMLAGLGSSVEELFDFMLEFGYKPYIIPNDYDERAYLSPIKHDPPQPLQPPLTKPSYILFSRAD